MAQVQLPTVKRWIPAITPSTVFLLPHVITPKMIRFPNLIYLFFVLVVSSTLVVGLNSDDMVIAGEKTAPSTELKRASETPRTLIILGTDTWTHHHKRFVDTLTQDGHHLTFHKYSSSQDKLPTIDQYNVALYDNIVLAALDKDHKPLNHLVSAILETFAEELRGNLLVLGGSASFLSLPFFSSLGITRVSDALVQDYFSNIGNDPQQILTKKVGLTDSVLSSKFLRTGIVFNGGGLSIDKKNALCFPFLESESTTFLNTQVDKNFIRELRMPLIGALQSRQNSRLVIVPSYDLCSDSTIMLHSPNGEFCREVSQWVFKQRGVLDWSSLTHFAEATQKAKDAYIVGEKVYFSVDLHQLKKDESAVEGNRMRWGKLNQDLANHLQFEHRMLNPYWRQFLSLVSHDDNEGKSKANVAIQCADKHGIFKAVIYLVKKGYTFVHLETLTPMRTRLHDDYERFLWIASPYYASIFVSLLFTVAVSVFLLFAEERVTNEDRKKV